MSTQEVSAAPVLATPFTHFHRREELTSWFEEAGFGDFNVFREDRRGWQAVGKKMPAGISWAEGD